MYDIDNMVRFRTFDETEFSMLKKCIIFYFAVGGNKEFMTNFDLSVIDNLKWGKIKQSLLPVLCRNEKFDLDISKNRVKEFLSKLLNLDSSENEFIQLFKTKKYLPELLFEDEEIICRIKNHPMALWKIREND